MIETSSPTKRRPQFVRLLNTATLFVLLTAAPAIRADDSLDVAIVKKTKAATVRLRVTLADGAVVQGSGFIAGSPNLVLTNAHVLGMLRDESRKPKKVEVIVHGGTANEKTYLARVLGVDNGSDLGVLYIGVKDLPEPIPLAPRNVEIVETQNVFIFGYPFGDELNKSITVTKSTVSGSRKTAAGYVQTQLAGGLHPGNSGGPIVDAKGLVIGVAVSGLKDTQIHFAVPVNSVHAFLGSRTHRWQYGVPYKDGTAVKMPITTMSYDPLGSVRTIRAEVWTGDPGPERSDSKSREPRPGDSERVKTELNYKNGLATGEITLPELPKGKTYWIQLFNVKNQGESYIAAKMFRAQPPLDRTPIVLAYKPQTWDPGKLAITFDAELKIRDKDGVDHSLLLKSQAELLRVTDGKTNPTGTTTAKLSLSNLKKTFILDGKEAPQSARTQQLLTLAEGATTTLTMSKEGELIKVQPNVGTIPARDRTQVSMMLVDVIQGLDETVVPLPGQQVTVDKPWTAKRDVMISVLGSPELATAELTYRYLGVRTINGRMEAIVKADGIVRGQKGEGLNIGGKMEVQSTIDIESGQVVAGTARVDVDLDLTQDGSAGLASGVCSVSLRRMPKAPVKP
jgi:S1-C subfamily serine protease